MKYPQEYSVAELKIIRSSLQWVVNGNATYQGVMMESMTAMSVLMQGAIVAELPSSRS
jgi:hypothetical protein